MKKKLFVLLQVVLLVFMMFGCAPKSEETQKEYREIVDMSGKKVKIPKNISKVVDLSDGFTTSVMQSFGVGDKVIALGTENLKEVDNYTFEDISGKKYSYENGMNPVTYLNPKLKDLPAVAKYEEAVNYEKIASLKPDIIILRKGFSSMNTMEYGTEEDIDKKMKNLENLGIPIVTLYGPPAYKNPDITKISKEIEVLGEVFNKQKEAKEITTYFEDTINMIKKRTSNIKEEDKQNVLLFGLSPNARKSGGAGDVLCKDTIESYFITDIVNAKNAYTQSGGWKILNTEHMLSLNPDVIILPTDWGYHPPKELYTAPYYQNLQSLKAIKNKRVWALPWTPYNCAKRLEYPIEVMVIAKASYPEQFKDIKINQWVLDFYKKIYHVDQKTAEKLRSVQWLDWTVEDDV